MKDFTPGKKEFTSQERVLSTKEHVVNVRSGDVHLCVRSCPDPEPDSRRASPQRPDASGRALRCGLSRVLELSEQRSLTSVAFPVAGPGIALQFPSKQAVHILAEEIGKFGRRHPKSVSTIRIVTQPNYSDSSEILLHLYKELKLLVQHQPKESLYFEYQCVSTEFKKTVSKKTIIKIERIQNVHLCRGYRGLKKQLDDKNGSPGGAMERTLFHGTKSEACESIQRNGFSQSFAGRNAVKYGVGVYFVANASYSANSTYSIPAADGTQCMFMARVVTGLHTLGKENMKVPPPRSLLQSDLYDSLADSVDNPTIFVVFHDNQAYPDYLITFK
ncbi:poly ADP-ribose polymerase 15-like [Arapaima gigas]